MDLWTRYVIEPLNRMGENFESILPSLFGAIILLLVGLILAFLLRFLITILLKAVDRFMRRRKIAVEQQEAIIGRTAPRLLSRVVFWFVFLFFLAAAIETLGQPVLSDWSNTIAKYLPNVLAAVLVLFVGIFFGNVGKAAVLRFARTSHVSQGEFLARLTQILILVTTVLIAIDQLGIEIHILIIILSIFTGMMAFGMALAFALGAKTTVSNIIASYYIAKSYKVGQNIRIGTIEGRIMTINLTGVVLETTEGILTIPSQRFSDEVSILLKEGI